MFPAKGTANQAHSGWEKFQGHCPSWQPWIYVYMHQIEDNKDDGIPSNLYYHSLCILRGLLALHVCLQPQFEDRSHKLDHILEFLFQGSIIDILLKR